MADYNQLKNAAILTPTTPTNLGSDANRYANIYLNGNIAMSNDVIINSGNAITPRVASLTYPGTTTAVIPAGGQSVTINGSGFSNVNANPTVIIGTTAASVVTYNNSTSITFTAPALSAGIYALYVINPDGGTAIYGKGLSYSGTPSWTTAAGSLGYGSSATSVSFTVAATSDSVIAYSVTSGSLPTGLSLNTSSGVISGTMPSFSSATTFNFTLTATDAENQTTARAFSIDGTVTPNTVDYLVVAGGGGGGGYYYAGGGGAGGLLSSTGFSVSGGITYTITVGAGGAAGAAAANGVSGSNSIFSSITTYGGGGGAGVNGTAPNGGSGGGGVADLVNAGGKGVYPGSTYISATRQGYDGGTSSSGGAGGASGGGGGAGGAGGSASGLTAGNGGIGSLQTIITSFSGTANTASSTTLTISAVSAGEIQVGTQVTGTGIPANTYITALGTGSGGTGTYVMSAAATATSTGVSITSSGRYFAGGGGGESFQGTNGTGGAGGGGQGAQYTPNNIIGGAGATNTGSGGGGASHSAGSNAQFGGAGGSGVVFVRYADTFPLATTTTNVSAGYPVTAGGYRIYKWITSGTLRF
jgi:hypothetical protein